MKAWAGENPLRNDHLHNPPKGISNLNACAWARTLGTHDLHHILRSWSTYVPMLSDWLRLRDVPMLSDWLPLSGGHRWLHDDCASVISASAAMHLLLLRWTAGPSPRAAAHDSTERSCGSERSFHGAPARTCTRGCSKTPTLRIG